MAILRNQKGGNDCGPTCFANALNLLGYDIKISQANKLCNLKRDGTDSDDLSKAFSKYGFYVREKTCYNKERAWKWLVEDTNKGLPIILSVDNDHHWLLVLRAGIKTVQIIDPSDKQVTKISKKEMLERWEYFEDHRDIARYHGLAFKPYKDKSICAVKVRKQILSTIDVR